MYMYMLLAIGFVDFKVYIVIRVPNETGLIESRAAFSHSRWGLAWSFFSSSENICHCHHSARPDEGTGFFIFFFISANVESRFVNRNTYTKTQTSSYMIRRRKDHTTSHIYPSNTLCALAIFSPSSRSLLAATHTQLSQSVPVSPRRRLASDRDPRRSDIYIHSCWCVYMYSYLFV